MKKLKKFTSLIPIVMMFLVGCSGGNADTEVEKLLDRQAKVVEQEQKSMEKMHDEFRVTRDSLKAMQNDLMNSKSMVNSEMEKLKAAQADLASTLKQSQIDSFEQEKARLSETLQTINDSIATLAETINNLESQQGNLAVREEQLNEQLDTAKERLVTGIASIDDRLDKIEKQRVMKQRELELNKDKIELSDRKIALLKDEKNLYLREKNELVAKNASAEDIEQYDQKIDDINGNIQDEKDKIENAGIVINDITAWMRDVNSLQNRLANMMDEAYSKNETIEQFTMSELERLSQEKKQTQSEMARLDSIRLALVNQQSTIDDQLSGVDEEIQLLKGKEISEILAKRSALDSEEAQLSQEEADLMAGKESQSMGSEEVEDDEAILAGLDKEIIDRRASLLMLKTEIAQQQQELAQKRAQIEQKRAKRASAAGISAGAVILIGLLIVISLYLIGRTRRIPTTA